MTEEKFVYGEQTFTYEKSDKEWKLSLRRSDVATQDLRELLILDLHHPLFLEQTMDADEDGLTFTYQLVVPSSLWLISNFETAWLLD